MGIIIIIILILIHIPYSYFHLFFLSLIENCEGREVFTWDTNWKASLQQYHRCWQTPWPPGSEQRTRSPTFALFPLRIPDSQSGCCICSGFSSQMRNPRLRKLQCVIMGCKRACLAPALEEDLTFIIGGSTHSHLLLQRKMLSLSPKGCAIWTSLKRWSRTKKSEVLLWFNQNRAEKSVIFPYNQ